MKHRLFIAINLDPQARAAIVRAEKDIENVFDRKQGERIRFMPEENWHITISFLGTQDDADLVAIMGAMRETVKNFSAINISFMEITYMPQRNNPRMIWLQTSRTTNQALGEIKDSLEHLLGAAGVRFEQEPGAFSGHITLARFQNGMSHADLPPIERALRVNYTGTSLDLMESELNRSGPRYTVLQKFFFFEA